MRLGMCTFKRCFEGDRADSQPYLHRARVPFGLLRRVVAPYNEPGVHCRKLDVQSGRVQTMELKGVPPPRRDPDAEPIQASSASGEEATLARGAKLIRSETAIASTSAQVCAAISAELCADAGSEGQAAETSSLA